MTKIEAIENMVMTAEATTTKFLVQPSRPRLASEDATEATAEPAQIACEKIQNSAFDSVHAVTLLETLEASRQSWEGKELAASHARLYAILTACYAYYLGMKAADSPKEVRAQMTKGLEHFIVMRKLRTLDKTHDMNKVVKAVFGEDRRRVSSYSMVLRVALTAGPCEQPLAAAELTSWIVAKGGIEEIRQGSKNGGKTAAERVEVAKEAVQNKSLMTFKPDPKSMSFDSNDVGKMMVLVVTYRPTGEIEVNSVVKSATTVNAALAAYYAANKDQIADAKASEELAQPTAVSLVLNSISNV